ncbi:MAG: hypothetical protein H6Q61_858 [Firmicutes bacterium]|nr:hypothetical protein [Bacillota bacterium]
MKIIHQYRNEHDMERIAVLACVCLDAIHQSRSGRPVYISTLFQGLAYATDGEMAG